MFNLAELYEEPLAIKESLSEKKTEMSELQSAMLCGLIKENRPLKIVEVGVAAGGTTAIILNCISMLGMDSEVYSVDVSEKYYRDASKKTGFLAEECKKNLQKEVKHNSYIGYLAEYLDEIGEGIDFLILDTMHSLPGEVLDFLAAFPYLKDGAVVVLHDIFLHQYLESANAHATRVLLSAVVGEKIVGRGGDNPYNFIELGAFKITQDTEKYIENIFSALQITWEYLPDAAMIKLYRDHLSRFYQDDLMEEFDMAVGMNKNRILKKQHADVDRESIRGIHILLRELENKENIFIYGCGRIGKRLCAVLEEFGIKVEGYVISDGREKPCENKEIKYISEIDSNNATIVLGMAGYNQQEVSNNSFSKQWISIDENVLRFLEMLK